METGTYHDTCTESTTNEEDTEAPVDSLEGLFDIDSRALRLCCHHRDVFRSHDTEGCCPKGAEETLKPAKGSRSDVFGETTGVSPVPESISIMLGIASHHRNEGEGESAKAIR